MEKQTLLKNQVKKDRRIFFSDHMCHTVFFRRVYAFFNQKSTLSIKNMTSFIQLQQTSSIEPNDALSAKLASFPRKVSGFLISRKPYRKIFHVVFMEL